MIYCIGSRCRPKSLGLYLKIGELFISAKFSLMALSHGKFQSYADMR
jgi:hypothetical protein